MKRTLSALLLLTALKVQAQPASWQQRTDYLLEVTLDTTTRSLDGFEKLTYHNASPDTLRYIWFHLWPNAFKNDRTAFTDQQLRNGDTRFYFSNKDERGYINRLDFRVNGMPARTEDHPQWIDVVKLLLPQPLAPGATAQITTPFHVKLPRNFSRGGYAGNTFQVTQWYPKPAVYDQKGWHPMPYLDQGEFYSEFGAYDVRITLPRTYK
ncbi:MAG: M1 family peptidase, partial [Chitinophagaceae bacterium]